MNVVTIRKYGSAKLIGCFTAKSFSGAIKLAYEFVKQYYKLEGEKKLFERRISNGGTVFGVGDKCFVVEELDILGEE